MKIRCLLLYLVLLGMVTLTNSTQTMATNDRPQLIKKKEVIKLLLSEISTLNGYLGKEKKEFPILTKDDIHSCKETELQKVERYDNSIFYPEIGLTLRLRQTPPHRMSYHCVEACSEHPYLKEHLEAHDVEPLLKNWSRCGTECDVLYFFKDRIVIAFNKGKFHSVTVGYSYYCNNEYKDVIDKYRVDLDKIQTLLNAKL